MVTGGTFASLYLAEGKADESPLRAVVEVHQQLEMRREEVQRQLRAGAGTGAGPAAGGAGTDGAPAGSVRVEATSPCGPRVLIVGAENSGKSTTTRILLAYAARMGWCPLFVDCDIGQGEITVPGTLSAAPVDSSCLSVERGIDGLTPISYFVGSVSPGSDVKLYNYAATRLAATVNDYTRTSPHARASGVFVNTMGWVDGVGFDILVATARTFAVDVVLVLGQVSCPSSQSPSPTRHVL